MANGYSSGLAFTLVVIVTCILLLEIGPSRMSILMWIFLGIAFCGSLATFMYRCRTSDVTRRAGDEMTSGPFTPSTITASVTPDSSDLPPSYEIATLGDLPPPPYGFVLSSHHQESVVDTNCKESVT